MKTLLMALAAMFAATPMLLADPWDYRGYGRNDEYRLDRRSGYDPYRERRRDPYDRGYGYDRRRDPRHHHDAPYDGRHYGGYRGPVGPQSITVPFGSDKERYAEYQVPGRILDVDVRQVSNAPCLLGRTWGYGENTLWADQGCRGYFTVTYAR